MKHITLADIAKETGYSINTVSHALRDKSDISEKTKKYIKETAQRLGYIENTAASSLRSGKTKTIAIIVGDLSNPHFSIMIKEMEGRLRKHGYNAFILNTDEDEDLEQAAIISAISKNVDGILICPVQKTDRSLRFLQSTSIPFVLFGRRYENDSFHYVICDDVNGGYVAAQHLLRLNHRRILFLNAPSYISSAQDRLCGVRRAVAEFGLPPSALTLCEIPISENHTVLADILKAHTDCTGVICFSDMIAMQVCYLLKEQKKDIPADVSVLGFDNIVSKFYLPLMLTSVTSSKTKMSTKAVDTLMYVIQNHTTEPQQLILPTKIIARETTGKITEDTSKDCTPT